MKVAGYVRVSTDGQCGEDKYGLDVQKAQIEEYCNEKGWEIIAWYRDEGESGAKERPGFDDIIYTEMEKPFKAVVVAKSDRVARDINVYFFYKMMLQKKEIKLISISEDFGSFGVFAPMLEAFTLCVAEMERDNIRKRTSSGRRAKAAAGGYSGGRPPYGYTSKDGQFEIEEEEARAVKTIFRCHAAGMTLQDICDMLAANEIKTRHNKQWHSSTVYGVLNNRAFYEGFYKYGDVETVKGKHVPIIDEVFVAELKTIADNNGRRLKELNAEIEMLSAERKKLARIDYD